MMNALAPPDQGTAAPSDSGTSPTPSAPKQDSSGNAIVPGQDIEVKTPHAPKIVQGAAPDADPDATPDPSASAIFSGGQDQSKPSAPIVPDSSSLATKPPVDQMMAVLQGAPMPSRPEAPAPQPSATPPAPFVNPTKMPMSAISADMGKGLVSGVENGVAGMAGIPGMASYAFDKGLDKIGGGVDWAMAHALGALGMLPAGETPETLLAAANAIPSVKQSDYLTPQTIGNAATKARVPLYNYQPQSVPGQYAKTAGEFLPAGIKAPITSALLPAIASETAGQVTKGTGLEGPARLAGALLGGAGGTLMGTGADATRQLMSGAPDIAAAQAAQRAGVPMPRMALSTKPAVQGMAMSLKTPPFIGTPIRQSADASMAQINNAVRRAAEIPTGSSVAAPEAGAAMKSALEDYIGPTSQKNVSSHYDKVDQFIKPKAGAQLPATPLNSTANTVAKIAAERVGANLEGNGKAVDHVINAVKNPSGLTYYGIKKLRSTVGEMLKPGRLPAETSEAELKQIYGSLTEDLKQSVLDSGSQPALSAFNRANNYARLVAGRREVLDKLLGTKSDEGIVGALQRLAGSNSSANIKLLTQARRSVGPADWNELSSAVIGNLGKNRAGEFSGDIFLSDYGKLSERAKSLLFGSTGAQSANAIGETQPLRKSLDDIAMLSEKMKKLQKFGNTSGTTQSAAGLGEIGAVLAAVKTGSVTAILTVLSGMVGGRALSSFLAKPITAEKIDKWARVYAATSTRPSMDSAMILARATRTLASSLQGSMISSQKVPAFRKPVIAVPAHKIPSAHAQPSVAQ